jgi:hypothetical protein
MCHEHPTELANKELAAELADKINKWISYVKK